MRLSALALASAIKNRELSPVEVVKHFLAVCDERNPELNAVVWRRDDDLLAEARRAEQQVMQGDALAPFHGVPIPLKDLTEALGQRVTHGSMAAKTKTGRYDSSSVQRLKAAGFLLMGRTNSPEFGTLPVTENTVYGATRNPWDPSRTPGGSSGGAAAAVAAGMAPIAHASDGGGSIRIPAACCGLVGLKPSRGRIPKGPYVSDVMHGFSTDGCISTNIADTAAMLDVLGHFDANAWHGIAPPAVSFQHMATMTPPRLRIGMTLAAPLPGPVDPSCGAAVTRTASALAALGHHVEEVQVDWGGSGEQLANDFSAIWCTSSSYYDFPDWSQVEPLSRGLREMAERQSSSDYIKAVVRLQLFSRRLVSGWGQKFDVLLTPTLPMLPPPIGWMLQSPDQSAAGLLKRCTEMVPYTGWCNITGQPALSLPVYVQEDGLPVGVQLVAAPYRDDLLLMVGQELENIMEWDKLLPVPQQKMRR